MLNCETSVKNDVLTITIDLAKEHGRSKSGKTIIIGTTQGNVEIAKDVRLGVNCYKS